MSNSRMREAYDTFAAEYRRINSAMPPTLLTLCEQFLGAITPGGRILDLGCGHGRDMAWMEARSARVTGADLSAGMLREAAGIVRGPLVQADMRALPFRDGCFAGVWCMASMLHLPKSDVPATLAEVRRVLAQGGTLALGIQQGESEGWEESSDVGVSRFFARYSPLEAEELLGKAGFKAYARGYDEARGRKWLQFLAVSAA